MAGGLLAGLIFLVLAGAFIPRLHCLTTKYRLLDDSIRVTFLGVRLLRIPYDRIQTCRIVKASRLWRPWNPLLLRALWLHTRFFADGVVVKAAGTRYVLTPKDPLEFVRAVREHRRGRHGRA